MDQAPPGRSVCRTAGLLRRDQIRRGQARKPYDDRLDGAQRVAVGERRCVVRGVGGENAPETASARIFQGGAGGAAAVCGAVVGALCAGTEGGKIFCRLYARSETDAAQTRVRTGNGMDSQVQAAGFGECRTVRDAVRSGAQPAGCRSVGGGVFPALRVRECTGRLFLCGGRGGAFGGVDPVRGRVGVTIPGPTNGSHLL